jgi:(1->4)-alpha-D-glucan 1-alpha-D-glucosylmutase
MTLRIPIATYRLQFNADFTFRDAKAIVDYLADLGISDIYSSPLLRPRTGSTHGYDIVDARVINPALGSEDDLRELHGAMDARAMGLLLDIVPNHMAASHENEWWMSVLENGPQSRFLHYFDIDWSPVASRGVVENKVMLPILGRPYGETLESQEIQLGFDEDGLFFTYYDKRLPLAPQSYHHVLRECLDALPQEGAGIEVREIVASDNVIANSRYLKETMWRLYESSPAFKEALDNAITQLNGEPGNQESFNKLDALLDAQYYRLAYWRTASETINYRRFFDVTDLVGLRIENPEVFELRNRRIFDLISDGPVSGLRIDHIDGLFDPYSHLLKLQMRLGDPATEALEQFYVVVEKILEHGETLPANFRVCGTTGYDFLDVVNALFVDPKGLDRLTTHYRKFTGFRETFDDVVYEKKKQAIEQLFAGEMRALGIQLAAIATADRNARDFAASELLSALEEITACMPVYRTYIRESEVSEADREFIRRAITEARQRAGWRVDARLFNFLELVLMLSPPAYIDAEREKWLAFVMNWQQFTGRVMAKGVEDTAFYNYNRLISLNEVGGNPGREGDFDPVGEFHRHNERIANEWPHTMNATSTHDTKRSEDVRARLNVLAEIAETWEREVRRWSRMNATLKRDGAPDANEELLVYQTLAGVWPFTADEQRGVPARLRLYLEKALREAKVYSSWLEPNAAYERAVQDFAVALLDHEPFMTSFRRLHRHIAFHGFLNSLAQVVLKVCSPGLPDFYQGTEIWDFSLVDPDNRRPVDYTVRSRMLRRLGTPETLLKNWKDGRVKLFVTERSLAVRARHAELFRDGSYTPIETGSANAVAFRRGEDVIAVVPRLTSQLARAPRLPIGDVWADLSLGVSGRWRNAFTGDIHESLALRDVLARFPVAVLVRD